MLRQARVRQEDSEVFNVPGQVQIFPVHQYDDKAAQRQQRLDEFLMKRFNKSRITDLIKRILAWVPLRQTIGRDLSTTAFTV